MPVPVLARQSPVTKHAKGREGGGKVRVDQRAWVTCLNRGLNGLRGLRGLKARVGQRATHRTGRGVAHKEKKEKAKGRSRIKNESRVAGNPITPYPIRCRDRPPCLSSHPPVSQSHAFARQSPVPKQVKGRETDGFCESKGDGFFIFDPPNPPERGGERGSVLRGVV